MESLPENALWETRARGVRKITCTGSCAGLHANFFTLLNIREPLAWNGGDAPSDLPGQVDLQFRCERLKRHPVEPESGKECHAAHL